MLIRPAILTDSPQIVKLGRHLLDLHSNFDKDYYNLEINFDELFTNWIQEQINVPSRLLLVAEDDNSMISGFISGYIKVLYPWFTTKLVGHIAYLVIDLNNRRKKIGKLLEEHAISWFKTKDVHYIEVFVDEKNSIGTNAWVTYGYGNFKKFLRKTI